MANLGIYTVKTDGKYQTLEDITGLTFEIDAVYQLQKTPANASLQVCADNEEPNPGEGFWVGKKVFEYTPKAGITLYFNTGLTKGCKLNIALKYPPDNN